MNWDAIVMEDGDNRGNMIWPTILMVTPVGIPLAGFLRTVDIFEHDSGSRLICFHNSFGYCARLLYHASLF